MSTTIVKNYNVGEIKLDLPSRQFIHELPLFSFSDIYQSVNVSLIFNSLMKEDGSNPFSVVPGYKLNLEKRLIFENSKIFVQDELGKIEEAYGSNNIYSLGDESKRIIRQKEENSVVTYEIEYYDYSKEVYNSAGKIITTYDKYGTIIFQYEYYSTGKLKKVCYRNKKSFNFMYMNEKLASISYEYNQGNSYSILFSYGTNKVNIAHYSGSFLISNALLNSYSINSADSINSTLYIKSKELVFNANNNSVTLTTKENSEVVNIDTYYSKEWTSTYDFSSQVDITNYYGVKIRNQYYGKSLLCSYEIYNNDIELIDGVYPKVVLINKSENEYNNNNTFALSVNDGMRLSNYVEIGDGYYCTTDTEISPYVEGYYMLTGWTKIPDNDVNYYIQINDNSNIYYSVPKKEKNQWRFFSYKFISESNIIKVNVPDASLQVADLRLTFQYTSSKDKKYRYVSKMKEEVLINKNTQAIIPLKSDTIFIDNYTDEIGYFFLSDLMKYKINQKKGTNTNEVYCNNCKNVINTSNNVMVFYYDDEENSHEDVLSNFDLGYLSYSESKKYVEKIIIDNEETSNIVIETIVDGTPTEYKYYNLSFELIKHIKDNVTTNYVMTNGLITSEEIENFYTRTVAYTVDAALNDIVTYTNEYGKKLILKYEPIWGTLISTTNPDNSIVLDEYDNYHSVLMERSITSGSVIRKNKLNYTNNYLTKLETGSLKYGFNYDKEKLINVNRRNTNDTTELTYLMEEHTYNKDNENNITETINYPSNAAPLVTNVLKFNKYSQLTNESSDLIITYDEDPFSYIGSDGNIVIQSLGVNGINGKVSSILDLTNNVTTKYSYEKNKINLVRKFNLANDLVDSEMFVYDNLYRPTQFVHEYDTENNFKNTCTITYLYSATSPNADNRISRYSFLSEYKDSTTSASICISAVSANVYNFYKQPIKKTHTINNKAFLKYIVYDKTRVSKITENNQYMNYGYDIMNRLSYISTSNYSIVYKYDDFDQISRENNGRLNKTYIYDYDNIGNLISKKIYNYTTMIDAGTPTSTIELKYLDTNYPDRLTSYNGKQITYNSVGEITSFDGYTYSWLNGRLVSMSKGSVASGKSTYTFTYNGMGQRIKRTFQYEEGTSGLTVLQPGQLIRYTKDYKYDSFGRLIAEYINSECYQEEQTDEIIKYLYDGKTIIGIIHHKDNVDNAYYFQRNLLGDVIYIYNTAGTKLVEYAYDAWGVCTIKNATDAVLANFNPIRYRGYYFDVETNLFLVTSRYYSPELGRFIQPADVSSLNPSSINGLNLYSYANNNPIGIAYSNSSVGGTTSSGMVNTIRSSMGNFIINNGSYNNYVDLNFLGNFFAFNENIYSSIAGVFEGIRRRQGLGQYESLAKASKILMHVGYWLNVGLSAYNNYHDSSLTKQEKWVSFWVDTVYTTGVTVGAYFLGMIPYVGPFLAILVPMGVEYLWSGELSIFGFDIDVQPIKINGKTIEEWVESWVNSWFE